MEMETNINPLTMDLSAVDTSVPLLKEDVYELRISKSEMRKTKDGQTDMLSLELRTTSPAKSVKDEPIGAGLVVFDQITLAPRGKSSWEQVMRSVAGLVQAAQLRNVQLGTVHQWYKQLEGRIVRAKVNVIPEGVSPSGKAYPAKNAIAYYLK